MSDEVNVVALCRAKPGQEDALRAVLLAVVEPSRRDAGVLSYVLNEAVDQPGQFAFIERYASPALLHEHMQTEHFKALMLDAKPLLDGDFTIAVVRPIA